MIDHINCVKHTSQIAEIYPDVSQQLCDKHSKLLSKLNGTFGQVYDEFQPQGFVIVNGIAKVLELGRNMQVNFAIENGITILYSKTYLNSEIFINGNQNFEEIVFDSSGKHVDGIHQKIHEIKQLIEQCMIKKKNKQIYGGIIYIYSNIGDKLFAYYQCLMLALLITVLSIFDQLQQCSKKDLISMLRNIDMGINLQNINHILNNFEIGKCNLYNQSNTQENSQNTVNLPFKSSKSIKTIESNQSIKTNRQKNNQFLQIPPSTESISSLQQQNEYHSHYLEYKEINIQKIQIPQAYKLIICQLDVSNQQVTAYHNKILQLIMINKQMEAQYNKQIIFEQNQRQNHHQNGKESLNNLSQPQLYDYLSQNRSLLKKLKNKQIGFEIYIRQKHILDLKYFIYDEGLIQLLKRIEKAAPFLENYCMLEGSVLLISIQKYRYAETMSFLRKLLNSNVLSTTKYLNSKKNWQLEGYGKQISEVMFTSLPSIGCAVFKAGAQNFEI